MNEISATNETPQQPLVDLAPYREHLACGRQLLTPGLRLARQLHASWLESERAPDRVAAPPRIAPVDAWLEQCWSEAVEHRLLPVNSLLNRLQERLLWQQVIERDLAKQPEFSLLQPASAAQSAMASRQALLSHADDLGRALADPAFQWDTDCLTFRRWLDAFEVEMRAGGWLSRFDAYRQLLSLDPGAFAQLRFGSTGETVANAGEVVLCHCLHLPPLTRRALEHLATVHEVGAAPAEPAEPSLPARRFIDRRAELMAAAEWAAEQHRAQSGTVGIVLFDMKQDRPELEYWLRRAFGCLDARWDRLPVNFSAGIPLAEAPMFRDILLALQVGLTDLSRAEFLSVIRSPYLHPDALSDSAGGLRLTQAVMDLATANIASDALSHLLHVHVPDSHLASVVSAQRHNQALRASRPIGEWVEILRAQLALWQWPARRALDSLEYQQLQRLEPSFDQLIAMSPVVGDVTWSGLLHTWRAVLTDMVFQPKTDTPAVQVMGPREAIGLNMTSIWVCGCQAASLPGSARLLPFLPAALQRDMAMRECSYEAMARSDAAMVTSWLNTHDRLIASCHLLEDGIEVAASRFLLIEQDECPRPRGLDDWHQPTELESIEERTLSALDGDTPFGGGATVLKNQALCPFKAYVTHRLGPVRMTEPAFGLTASERGSLVHEALDRLWRRLQTGDALQACDEATRQRWVHESVRDALSYLESRSERFNAPLRPRVGGTCLDLECERVTLLLIDWLALEAQRDSHFSVVEQESEHHLTIGPLTLRLRPDRIDQLGSGRRLVIDYKTGMTRVGSWLGERLDDPQLPIYALLDEAVEGIAFARLKRDDKDALAFDALGENLGLPGKPAALADQLARLGEGVEDWASLRLLWRQRLEGLANEYAAGEARVQPSVRACRTCDLDSVCRFALAVDTSEEEGVL